MLLIELTTKEKIFILNQVVKIVEKNEITCQDAFVSIMSKMDKMVSFKEYITEKSVLFGHGRSLISLVVSKYFPEVENEFVIKIESAPRTYRVRVKAWLRRKDGKRQRVYLNRIREIYIQKYFEETNKPGKNKIPVSVISEHSKSL
ncbi:MAG: hypothetical protein LBT24_04675 [Tannerella sp.]|jgi:hypothetical protein|nr:hypothetical protein [Tannerella sp.]